MNRAAPARNGSSARRPRYGLAVTASTPSPSKSATAWRATVVSTSPRFASAMTGMPAGIAARTRSRAARPGLPKASKKARFGFMAAANGAVASTISRANRSTPARPAGNPAGTASGVGSIPTHSTLPTDALRAASASR